RSPRRAVAGPESTRPWRATPGVRPSWPGPRAPAGRRGAHWPGRSSTRPAAPWGPRAGSKAESPSGAWPPSSPGPMAGSRSFTDCRGDSALLRDRAAMAIAAADASRGSGEISWGVRMGVPLASLSFADWLAFVFDHPVTDPEWYFADEADWE